MCPLEQEETIPLEESSPNGHWSFSAPTHLRIFFHKAALVSPSEGKFEISNVRIASGSFATSCGGFLRSTPVAFGVEGFPEDSSAEALIG